MTAGLWRHACVDPTHRDSTASRLTTNFALTYLRDVNFGTSSRDDRAVYETFLTTKEDAKFHNSISIDSTAADCGDMHADPNTRDLTASCLTTNDALHLPA
jgi:hypothetical protein